MCRHYYHMTAETGKPTALPSTPLPPKLRPSRSSRNLYCLSSHRTFLMASRTLRLIATLSTLLLVACNQAPPYTGGDVAELQRIDVATGQGAVAAAGDEVSVHYTGWLYDQNAANKRGQKFDSSRDRGQPFVFLLGAGRVIRGWDEGVTGMRVGGKRELYIPTTLGYGRAGAGNVIPPGASLVFEVELLDVRK